MPGAQVREEHAAVCLEILSVATYPAIPGCTHPFASCFTPYGLLYQFSDLGLLYTNLVEVMTPVFEMEYFDELVRPTLYRAHFGWLLDFLWPWLLGYPTDKIAVVESVCVFHPQADRHRADSLYKKGMCADCDE